MHPRTLLLFSTLSAFSGALMADSSSDWQLIGQWDNDLLTGTDDGYTNGARIAFVRELPSDSKQHNALQESLRKLTGSEQDDAFSEFRFPDSGPLRFQYGIGLSQLMFTPDDPEPATPTPGQRPYAGWLGLEFSLQASAGDSASTATLSIGTTGQLSYAQDMQKWVHENVSDSPIFQGWDTQAPGELTVNLHLDHKQRLRFLDATQDWPIEFDGFYEWGGALGNFRTDAYIGALMRFGLNLPASHTEPRVQLGSFTATIFEGAHSAEKDHSLYGLVGLRGYAVLHDITLDGPVFRDWSESVDSELWVSELSYGLATRWRSIELSLTHTVRSDEFEDQRERSRYGSVLLKIGSRF
jgi:hypothetical protein